MMTRNPNAFFYRNRPPSDPQRFGSFTREEEELFLQRMSYFRNILHTEEGLWGLFAVPIRGRVGYQCSNFYRQLIKEHKLVDDRYELLPNGDLRYRARSCLTPPASIAILEHEAFAFINECMCRDDGETPRIVAPIWVETDNLRVRPLRTQKPRPREKPPQTEEQGEDVIHFFGRDRKLPERKYDPLKDDTPGRGKGGYLCRSHDSKDDDEDLRCPLYGILDPLTDDPMLNPMMDRAGYVMDLQSWRRVFKSGDPAPFPSEASSERDLEAITSRNYADLRFYILNMAC
jgi:hypothetical protein